MKKFSVKNPEIIAEYSQNRIRQASRNADCVAIRLKRLGGKTRQLENWDCPDHLRMVLKSLPKSTPRNQRGRRIEKVRGQIQNRMRALMPINHMGNARISTKNIKVSEGMKCYWKPSI